MFTYVEDRIFFSRYAYGLPKLDKNGKKIGIKQSMQKKGDPSFTFGQGSLGGLSNLDQRKLNIMYCESAKANLVKTELAKTLRHTLREYEADSSRAYSKALTEKLGKIYALFQFSITVFGETTTQSEYNFKSNGKCPPAANSQLAGYGKSIIVCWTRKGSFNVQTNKQKPRRLGSLLSNTLKAQTVSAP